ncbi:DUF4123 domain-containing protein [Pseudoduganella eburnea]|uniref:DUF4123 domain-containing protein n=1 Tax=Massilia eburnea TaxID=1776165 RepID=A0A6L6QG22_9BURK|nr:DUF4123 domain-containing protein [Massilia eburnea]MTW11044.1 DUF4123 domain-containing protein [Massilia eburnea]
MLALSDLEQIYASHCRHGEERLYLLADHAGLPELSHKLRANGVSWTNLLGDDKRPALTAASPLLFEVSFSNGRLVKRQLMQRLHDIGQHSFSLLMIATPLEPQVLAKSLAKRMDGILSEGEEIVLRFFDTRVLPQLLEVMNEHEQRIWLSVATGWWYSNRDGTTAHISSEFQPQDAHLAPQLISDEQLSYLLEASEIDQIAYLLESNLLEQFHRMCPIERYRLLQSKITAARALRLANLGDLALFCGLAFLHGAQFDTQAPWCDILARVRDGELTLDQAVELVDQREELH